MVDNLLGLTQNPLLNPQSPIPEKSKAQQSCEANGGKWDPTTNSCIMPEPKPVEDDGKNRPVPVPGTKGEGTILTDPRTGKTFIVNPTELAQIQGNQGAGAAGGTIGSSPATFQTQAEVLATQQEGVIEEERQKLIDEEVPERRELGPDLDVLERTPVIGGLTGIFADYVRPLKTKLGFKTNEGLQPEELRSLALSEIEREEIERGLTASEGFGRLIEAIPVAGGLAAKYASGLIETPGGNAREVKSNILKEKRRISNIETNVKLGYLPVSVANGQIEDIEQNVQRLESRIRMLIYKSPSLRFNSDFVNTIETEILATKEKVFQGKQNILTGVSEDPSEIALLQKIASLGEEDV